MTGSGTGDLKGHKEIRSQIGEPSRRSLIKNCNNKHTRCLIGTLFHKVTKVVLAIIIIYSHKATLIPLCLFNGRYKSPTPCLIPIEVVYQICRQRVWIRIGCRVWASLVAHLLDDLKSAHRNCKACSGTTCGQDSACVEGETLGVRLGTPKQLQLIV